MPFNNFGHIARKIKTSFKTVCFKLNVGLVMLVMMDVVLLRHGRLDLGK